MKTKLTFLLVALLTCSFAFAEDAELMVNGDFESPLDYDTFDFEDSYSGSVVFMPGYIGNDPTPNDDGVYNDMFNRAVERWNVIAMLKSHDVAEELIGDDNNYYYRAQRYRWNGWSPGGLQQAVKIVAGETYELSCISRGSEGTNLPGVAVPRWIRVHVWDSESGAEGAQIAEMPIDVTTPWTEYTLSVPTEDWYEEVMIYIGLTGGGRGGAGGEEDDADNVDVYQDYDNVSFFGLKVPDSLSDISVEGISVVKSGSELVVAGAEYGSKYALYNVSGKMLTSGTIDQDNYSINVISYPKGVYIVKINNLSSKVIL